MKTDGSNELTSHDVIVVSYDKGNMPPPMMNSFANKLRRTVKKAFPNNRVLVMDHTVKITILR